ncbi:MAG: hypothetical protein HC913_03730 [Microscillaceae bacterium]|nr:hypothetical protein [Microscillaceae bacterium]
MKNITVCFFSIIFSFLTLASLFAQSEAKFRIPVKPVTEKNKGEMLYCNLETNRVEYNEAAAWRSAELANCRCDVFISTYDETECLGVEKYPADPERAVTMVGLNNPVQHCIVWVWNGDGTLRPLNDLQKCLTFLGWANRKRAFSVANYTGADHQVWTFDEKTQAIVNTRTAPIRDKTNTVDRYAQLIAWSYNGSFKQTWKRASTLIAAVQAHPSPQRYPVKLLVNADGSLREPASVLADRAKMGLNQLMAANGQTAFQRDFSSFPGTVSSEKALTEKRLRLDMQYNHQGRQVLDNWKSTGMYAPPSQDFEIRIHNTEPVYFKVRFNPHTDKLQTTSPNILTEKEYRRSPTASSVVSLSGSNETFRLRNDLGGLIIIEADGPPNQVLDISIRALEAPYYNGTQSQTEWESMCIQATP